MSYRLLKTLDLEEILDDLGVDTERDGAEAKALCPHPDHVDSNPSFHVCVEDVIDSRGRRRLGWYNCWSCDFCGRDFVSLVAQLLSDFENDRPTREDRVEALEYLTDFAAGQSHESLAEVELRRRANRTRRVKKLANEPLKFPTLVELDDAPRVRDYLLGRGIPRWRLDELGIKAVLDPAPYPGVLRHTVPGAWIPIYDGNKIALWYLRSSDPTTPSSCKGRYPPVPIGPLTWSESGNPDPRYPVVLVEGIFDAERVARIARETSIGVPSTNVLALLGGALTDAQAVRLRRYSAVTVLADGDRGGDKLLETVRARLPNSRLLRCPDGSDPADLPESRIITLLRLDDVRVIYRFRWGRAVRPPRSS